MKCTKEKYLTKILFIVYFLLLIWIILFKFSFTLDIGTQHNINLIPFNTSVMVNGKLQLKEIIENVIIFIPFGIYISILKPKWSFIKKVIPSFFTSLIVETLQYILAIGASDITDLISNTLGSIIGILLFYLLNKLLKKKTILVINILAIIGTVIIIGFLSLIFILN